MSVQTSRVGGTGGIDNRTSNTCNHSRYNAVKHGLTAKTLVLPGEHPAALQGKIDAYKADSDARNEAEEDLAEMAAIACWKFKQANRLEVNRVTRDVMSRPQADALQGTVDAVGLGERLLFDRRGPEQLYPS
jgi:hypothetical protein